LFSADCGCSHYKPVYSDLNLHVLERIVLSNQGISKFLLLAMSSPYEIRASELPGVIMLNYERPPDNFSHFGDGGDSA
jgi:hypothetical protein